MKLIKFVIDQKKEVNIPCNYVPRLGENVIINQKIHFVDEIVFDTGTDELTIHLLSQEEWDDLQRQKLKEIAHI